jgi:hypothetical protein
MDYFFNIFNHLVIFSVKEKSKTIIIIITIKQFLNLNYIIIILKIIKYFLELIIN